MEALKQLETWIFYSEASYTTNGVLVESIRTMTHFRSLTTDPILAYNINNTFVMNIFSIITTIAIQTIPKSAYIM